MTAREEQRAGADAARQSEATGRSADVERGVWYFDAEGDPMVEISFSAHELIGLENFSNIVVGPATVRTLVSTNRPNPFTEAQKRNLASALNQVAELVEVDVVAEQRGVALGTLDPSQIRS